MVRGQSVIVPLRCDFQWTAPEGRGVEATTEGALQLYVGGRLCWGRANAGARWSWSGLLEGLSRCWTSLLFEPAPSVGVDRAGGEAARLSLLAAAHRRVALGDADDEWLSDLDEGLFEWEQRHELSRFLPGVVLQEVAIYAVPGGVEFTSGRATVVAAPADAEAALEALGDQIAARLDLEDDYSVMLLDGWRRRHAPASDAWAARCSGNPEAALRHARGVMDEAEAWGDDRGLMARTVYLALASACRDAGRHTMARAFEAVRTLPTGGPWNRAVDRLALTVNLFGSLDAAAVPIAAELRGMAGFVAIGPASPAVVASALGIVVLQSHLDEASFPGLTVLRKDRAPLILLNARAFDPRNGASMRFAVAVGLATLLRASLAGIEMATSLAPGEPDGERNRVAFELLLPTAAVANAIGEDPAPGLVERLCGSYEVDVVVASCQLLASGAAGLATQDDLAIARLATLRPDDPRRGFQVATLRLVSG